MTKLGKTYNLSERLSVVWNRRPGKPFEFDKVEQFSQAVQKYISDQWYSSLEAIQLIEDVTWINHPHQNNLAENKPRQLLKAIEQGFNIPDTLISNSLKNIQEFTSNYSSVVAKSLYSPLIEEPEQDYFIFTNKISLSDLTDEIEFKISPSIFQECITHKVDYRVTVIGEEVIPVRIDMSNKNGLDWRLEKGGIEFNKCELPHEVVDSCRRYVNDFGLIFGAIDLVEYHNKFYFLEINPNGEWGWLQKKLNVNIAQNLCEIMINNDIKK
ncbi:MAG: hypothetical protein QQN41_03835 [Nitrosopumilus sp.]